MFIQVDGQKSCEVLHLCKIPKEEFSEWEKSLSVPQHRVKSIVLLRPKRQKQLSQWQMQPIHRTPICTFSWKVYLHPVWSHGTASAFYVSLILKFLYVLNTVLHYESSTCRKRRSQVGFVMTFFYSLIKLRHKGHSVTGEATNHRGFESVWHHNNIT